jgi:tetratricopeptide (TPR) repeat protein
MPRSQYAGSELNSMLRLSKPRGPSPNLYFLKKYDEAIADLNKTIEFNPKFYGGYHNRALSYQGKGDHLKAIEDFNKAIQLNPQDAQPYKDRGVSWNMLGNYDLALSDLNKALKLNPRHVSAYINRGNTWLEKGDKKSACSDWQKACDLGDCSAMNSAREKDTCEK